MSNTLNNYALAIAAGNLGDVAVTLGTTVKVLPPGGNQPNEGKGKAAMMLSTVARVIEDFKLVRTYESSDNWHAVLLEGLLDGTAVQFIDQVHIGDDDLVDHVDIFLRPASLAPVLLAKMTEEIQKRIAEQE